MKSHLYAVALVTAFMLSPSFAQPPAQAPSLPPIEAFATLPIMASPALSPDGKHLAMIQILSGRPVATIWTVEAMRDGPKVIPYDDGFIQQVRWASDKRLLVRINRNKSVWRNSIDAWFRLVSVDAEGKNPALMFSDREKDREINSSTAEIADLAPADPDHIYMPLFTRGGTTQRNNLFRVDVRNGHTEQVESGNSKTIKWFMDGSGSVLARLDEIVHPLEDHVLARTPDKQWKELAIKPAANGNGLTVYGLSLDGRSLVIATTSATTGTDGISTMSLADGSIQPAYFDPKFDIGAAITDPWSGRVIGVSITGHLAKDNYFDPGLQKLQDVMQQPLVGRSVHLTTWDASRRELVFSTDGPSDPPVFFLVDLTTKAVVRLGNSYPGLKAANLGHVKAYPYKARDGLEIPAYLTLPPGKEAKNLPVVLLPHGGPMARDDMSFDWQSQFLANRGYAVLRPNFRGSYGYGRKFMEAGYGEWGLKMQDDISDGVQKLVADGIADPKRICIVGGSYGGYAALAGAAFTPDLYACAAAWAPVTDLRRMLMQESKDTGGDSAFVSASKRFIGDHWSDSERLDNASPAEHAGNIRIPVLLMHGEDDTTVRIEQSEEMDRALRHAGKRVTFIRIKKESHYMETSDTRIRWLTELEKFLKDNIGN